VKKNIGLLTLTPFQVVLGPDLQARFGADVIPTG
jgi:hypothetical protein